MIKAEYFAPPFDLTPASQSSLVARIGIQPSQRYHFFYHTHIKPAVPAVLSVIAQTEVLIRADGDRFGGDAGLFRIAVFGVYVRVQLFSIDVHGAVFDLHGLARHTNDSFDIVRRLAVFFYAGEDDNVKTFWFREPVGYFVQQEIFLIMKVLSMDWPLTTVRCPTNWSTRKMAANSRR